MAIIITKEQVAKTKNINHFIKQNKKRLVGSSVFTRNDSFLSKVIQQKTKWQSKQKDFIPSHVGQIVSIGDCIYVFDMKPPRAKLTLLESFLTQTTDDYVLVLREFNLDTCPYCEYVLKHNGKTYPYLSGFQCAFRVLKYIPNIGEHCSEIGCKALQNQGLLLDMVADNTSPIMLYERLITM